MRNTPLVILNNSVSLSRVLTEDDYRAHTSCISEAERYEKTVYRGSKKGSTSNAKKMSPQEAWNCLIAEAVETAPPSIRSNMERLAMLDNVPRKQKQFRNFTANSLKLSGRDADAVDAMWTHLSKLKEEEVAKKKTAQEAKDATATKTEKKDASDNDGEGDKETRDVASEHTERKKEASRTATSNDLSVKGDQAELEPRTIEAKKLNKTMKRVFKKVPRNKMKMKELRRKVMAKMKLKQNAEKELRKAIAGQIGANPKKFKLEGKFVLMLK